MGAHHIEPLEKRRLLSSFLVNTVADPTTCDSSDNVVSLREAIARANASSGDDAITLPAGNYPLSNGPFGITDASGEIAIHSTGGVATIDAQGFSRIFRSGVGTSLALRGLELVNGRGTTEVVGPALVNPVGGAIYTLGRLS